MKQYFLRISPTTLAKVKALASLYGYYYGGKPSLSKFLTAIAEGELEVIKKNLSPPIDN